MTRLWGLLLLVAVLAGCTAPSQPPPAAVPTPQEEPTELVVAVDALPPGFNPHLLAHSSPVTTAVATLVLPSVFRPTVAGGYALDPTIATEAAVTSTAPFTVSYELNLEAAWSTNTPIAAEDFVYLWERMRSEPGTAGAAGYGLITDVRSRAGGKAVDVVFSQPFPEWQQLFANLLPAHILKDAPGSWTGATASGLPASGGPFRIANLDRARGEIVLARNDLYWDTPAVLDQLVLRGVETSTAAAGLTTGDVDVAVLGSDPVVAAVLGAATPPPRQQSAPQPAVVQLAMRADGGPLADPRARQGLATLIDRDAVRATVAPDALPADAFGLVPSQPGYASTRPADRPAAPDPAAAAALFAAAGWTTDPATGRWSDDGAPVRFVLGAAADRELDQRVARAVAAQLDAAGIDTTVVVPTAVELFGAAEVPNTPPSTSVAPGAPSATPTPGPSAGAAPTGAPTATPTLAPGAPVRPDLVVTPRAAATDRGSALASAYGCALPSALVPVPPRNPTGFCFPTLAPLLDSLLSDRAAPDTADVVERVLWAQQPALPLFQPVAVVVSTPAADAATDVGPGPLTTGPLTGAERWRRPDG